MVWLQWVVAVALGAPELPPPSEPAPPVESAPPPSSDSPPVQRPSTLPPPAEAPPPTAVDTPPATTPPVTAPVEPPQPIEVTEQPTPPVATTPAPAPRIEQPVTSDPFAEDAPAPPRPISPAFRRPGAWVAAGFSFFALSTVLRFVLPTAAGCKKRPTVEGEARECVEIGAAVALSIVSIPVDAMTMVSFGFAGRSYGLRESRRTDGARRRRGPFIGAGVALAVGGAALSLAGLIRPLVRPEPDAFSYEIAAVRQAGIAVASGGAFLLGYGIALPRTEYAAHTQRRFALAPSFGRSYVGVALAWRR
jgi:hypothetical protein